MASEFNITGDPTEDAKIIAPYIQSAREYAKLSPGAKGLVLSTFQGVLDDKYPSLAMSVQATADGRIKIVARPR